MASRPQLTRRPATSRRRSAPPPRTRMAEPALDDPRAPLIEQRAGSRPGPADPLVEPPPGGNWRENVVGLSGLNVLAGIWLIIAPAVLGYVNADPAWNDVLFGIIVAVLAAARVAGAFREAWLSAVNAVIGVWLFVAAFTIDVSGQAAANDIILGIIVFLLGVGSAASTRTRSAVADPAAH